MAELDFPAGRGFTTQHPAGNELRRHRGGDHATDKLAATVEEIVIHGR